MIEGHDEGAVSADQVAMGPVTKEEVRAAWQAGNNNAAAIRAVIGRGSMGTIQKHLVALRDEARAAAAMPAETEEERIPKMPAEVLTSVQSLWATAWSAAQSTLRVNLARALDKASAMETRAAELEADAAVAVENAEALAAELDDARAQLEAEREHGQALAASLSSDLEAARAATAEVEARLNAEHATFRDESWKARQAQADALGEAKAAHARDLERAEAARQLQEARHEAAVTALQAQVDRLVSQLADLRTALAQRQQTAATDGPPSVA